MAVILVVLAACGAHASPLVDHASRHAQRGEHALAYADYRRALHVEVPPGDPAFDEVRQRARSSFHRWIAARLEAAEAARRRGDAYEAYTIAAGLLAGDLGAMAWEDKERRFVTLEERLSADERTRASEVAEQTFPEAWRRTVAEPLAEGRYVAAFLHAEALATTFPEDHDVRKRARQVRETAAAKIAGDSTGTAGALLGAVRQRLTATPAARIERSTASLRFDERPESGTCAEWPAPQAPTTQGLAVSVTLTREACEAATHQHDSTETYQEPGEWQEKLIPASKECRSVPYYRDGIFVGSKDECTPIPARTERFRDTVTRTRTIHHFEQELRWRGVATASLPWGTLAVPFDVHGMARRSGETLAVGEVQREAWQSAADEIVRQVAARVDAARATRAAEDGATAVVSGRASDAEEAFAIAVSITANAPDAAYAWFDRRYGLDREHLLGIFEGKAWDTALPATARARHDLDPPAVDCPMCLGTRTQPLDYARRGLTLGGLTYARTGDDRNNVVVHVDTRTTDGLSLGAGLELGYAFSGLLYGTSFRIGYGVSSTRLRAGINAGGGLSGAAWGDVPFAFELPVEVALGYTLLPTVRIAATARASWVTAAERDDGAPDASFADELRVTAGVQLGAFDYRIADHGQGFYLGLDVRELVGIRSVGITIGMLGL